MQPTALASIVAFGMLSGCALAAPDQDAEPVGDTTQSLEIENQSFKVVGFLVALMGHGLNGTALNGTTLDGHAVLYASLSGVQWNGEPVTDVALDGTEFSGRVNEKKSISAAGFVGAVFPATLEDGTALSLTLEATARSEEHANKDVLLHWLSYPAQDGQRPLCGVDENGGAIPAIPLAGRPDTRIGEPGGGGWIDDPGVVTFACSGYVMAKCVDLGYKPWREGRICTHGQGCTTVSLAAHHRACTRMLRADFCGDGEAHSVDGVPVGLYDAFGIRLDAEDWPIEAEWTADGARCASRPRVGSLPLPGCWASLQDPSCGALSHFNEGALIFTESAP